MITLKISGCAPQQTETNYQKLYRKLVSAHNFVIPTAGEIYFLSSVHSNNEETGIIWTMIYDDGKLIDPVVYTDFKELVIDLDERDIKPEEIYLLADEQIKIQIEVEF